MTETSKNRERARAALAALGISQAELARALSVSPQIVSGVLRGNLSGLRGDAHRVAVAVGIKAGELCTWENSDDMLKKLHTSIRSCRGGHPA